MTTKQGLSDEEKARLFEAATEWEFARQDTLRYQGSDTAGGHYDLALGKLLSVVDAIAEERARTARELLKKASAFLPLMSSIERQETAEYVEWLQRAIAAEPAKLKEKP